MRRMLLCIGPAVLLCATGCADQAPPIAERVTAADERSADQPLVFRARLIGGNVAPEPVEADAHALATAVLVGDRLTVHGSFTALSSRLRDIEKSPDDPGIHLHPGGPGEVNPYLFGLQARLNPDERSGTFTGTFELNEEQLKLLLSGRMYIDIHTVANDPGEVRDQLHAEDKLAAESRLSHVERRLRELPPAVREVMQVKVCKDPENCTCEPPGELLVQSR